MAKKRTRSKILTSERITSKECRQLGSELYNHNDETPVKVKPKRPNTQNGSSPSDLLTFLDKGSFHEETNRMCHSDPNTQSFHRNMSCDSKSESDSEICHKELETEKNRDVCNGASHNGETKSPLNGIRPVSFYGGESCMPQRHYPRLNFRTVSMKKRKKNESCTVASGRRTKNSKSIKRKLKTTKGAYKKQSVAQPRKKAKTVEDKSAAVILHSPERENGECVLPSSHAETDKNGSHFAKASIMDKSESDSFANESPESIVSPDSVTSVELSTSPQAFHPKNFYGNPKTCSRLVLKQRLKSNTRQGLEVQSTCSEDSFASGPVVSNSSKVVIKQKGNEFCFSDPFETSPESVQSQSDFEKNSEVIESHNGFGKEIKKARPSASLDKYLVAQSAVIGNESSCPSLTSLPTTLADSDSNFSLLSEENDTDSQSSSVQSSPSSQASIKKYFKSAQSLKKGKAETTPSRSGSARKITRGDKSSGRRLEQMYLDFGQKDFGHVTCTTCGMVYTKAQPDDEGQHLKFHKRFVSGLRFPGWKNERVLQEFVDGRIIMVTPDDHHLHVKKVEEIRKVVDSELGFVTESPFRRQEAKTFLFVSMNKKVVGCAVAVHISEGFPVMPNSKTDSTPDRQLAAWSCSTTPSPAQCGISRIWVFGQFRRKKIATRLVDCIRNNFMYGCNIEKEMLAFSDPTPDGKGFAQAYSGTAEFLVFR